MKKFIVVVIGISTRSHAIRGPLTTSLPPRWKISFPDISSLTSTISYNRSGVRTFLLCFFDFFLSALLFYFSLNPTLFFLFCRLRFSRPDLDATNSKSKLKSLAVNFPHKMCVTFPSGRPDRSLFRSFSSALMYAHLAASRQLSYTRRFPSLNHHLVCAISRGL